MELIIDIGDEIHNVIKGWWTAHYEKAIPGHEKL